jgi:hypothetical protein
MSTILEGTRTIRITVLSCDDDAWQIKDPVLTKFQPPNNIIITFLTCTLSILDFDTLRQ